MHKWKTKSRNKRYLSELLAVQDAVKKWNFKRYDFIFIKLNTQFLLLIFRILYLNMKLRMQVYILDKIQINPNLNDYQFHKMIDVLAAFQSIQSYISGVLGAKENDIIEVDNTSKILKVGFDLKTSLRKDKQK